VLTAHEDESYLDPVVQGRAVGYVLKCFRGDQLVQAIRMAVKGQVYLEPALAGKALARLVTGPPPARKTPGAQLSGRRRKSSLIAWGYSNKEAADRLKVSVKTVETYRVRIAEKLGLRSRTQRVKYALRQGWLTTPRPPTPCPAETRPVRR